MAKRRVYSKKQYSTKSLIREREYGFYWYAWLWGALRPVVVFLCSLIITVGIAATGWRYVYGNFLKPISPDDPTTITFDIAKGASVSTIANDLVEKDLLRNKGIFKYVIMFQGLTNKIHYGSYQISPSMSVNEIVQVLTSGSASTERTVTIIPGWTVDDIGRYLKKVGAIQDEQEFYDLCNDTVLFGGYYTVQQAVADNSLAGRKYALEGYLAPNTYRVFTDATPELLIRTLLDQTDTVLNDIYNAMESEDSNSGEEKFTTTLNRDQTIILASMIEKEAGKKEEYSKVSAVFHNRLRSGMRLDSDPTVKYTLGINKMVLNSEELGTQSHYNTYVIDGLPVGPICNPSPDAIKAALYPDMTYINEGYLYFCSKEPASGELQFSKTLEEHNSAVAQYRPLWEQYDAQQAAATPTPEPSVTPGASVDPSASPSVTPAT